MEPFILRVVASLISMTVIVCSHSNPSHGADKVDPSAPNSSAVIARGPLKIHPSNPRYFTDGTGKAIYLTGSHNDANFMDAGTTDPPPIFDFSAHLTWLKRNNHNFIRLWRWTEAPKFKFDPKGQFYYVEPHPWMRTGPGTARDGKLRFDLSQFNQSYFDRLRNRAIEAGKHGIYVSIMLFEGGAALYAEDFWAYHPFHRPNNINDVEADQNGDGKGLEFYTLQDPNITARQKSYVRKVIETVNGLDNVLYEISNETNDDSTDWQYMLIRYIKEYESGLSKQHPVGMTTQHGYSITDNSNLLNSPADWISPTSNKCDQFASDPPVLKAGKVSLLDSDHITPGGSYVDVGWVWKSFTRGHNPIFLDLIDRSHPRPCCEAHPCADCVRVNMGYARKYANKIDLADMTPHNESCSSRYCLANPGQEYLVYVPAPTGWRAWALWKSLFHSKVKVDLTPAPASIKIEWFNTATGETQTSEMMTNESMQVFRSPFTVDSVLHLAAIR